MIQEFILRFDDAREKLRERWSKKHPESWGDIVRAVVEVLKEGHEEDYASYCPDPERITVINHGHYQGTLVFVIGCTGYQPSSYWAVKISYGSCSGCDALQEALSMGDYGGLPNEQQIEAYMRFSLMVVQKMEEIGGGS